MNTKNILFILLTLAVVILSASSCNKSKENITGIWQLSAMEVQGTRLSGNSLGNWLWEFNGKGGYLTDIAGAKEKGRYKIAPGKLTLQPFDSKNRPPMTYNILRLDTATMDLASADSTTNSTLHFYKRSGEEVTGDKD